MTLATRILCVPVLAFILTGTLFCTPALAQNDRVQAPSRGVVGPDERTASPSLIAALPDALQPVFLQALARDAAYSPPAGSLVWVEQKVTASDAPGIGQFGWSVAIQDDTALIGASLTTVEGNDQQGAVYVFTKVDGVWTETQKLTASDGAAFDFFGFAVALDGSTALVSALYTADFHGAVYVFTESDGVWTETQKLVASDGTGGEDFGYVVALDGATALVSAPYAAVGGAFGVGAAYVFTESGGTWSEAQKLTASDGAEMDGFGYAVALDDATALIGKPVTTIGGSGPGAAYVFMESGGTWAETQKLTASDGEAGDDFGYAVALDGATALIGANYATVEETPYRGAAYVFTEAGGTWNQTQQLTAADGAGNDYFGTSVALSGTTALVGALYAAEYQGGAAYVFTEADGAWNQTAEIIPSDGLQDDTFGTVAALDGDDALVGAYDRGAAYFFAATDPPEATVSTTSIEVEVGAGEIATTSFVLSNEAAPDAADLTFDISTAAAPQGRLHLVEAPVHPAPARGETGPARLGSDGRTGASAFVAYDGAPRAIRRGEEIILTHSLSQEIVPGAGVSCNTEGAGTAENSFWRVFDLSEFDLAALSVTSVDVGIEEAAVTGSPVSTVRLYTLDGPFRTANLTLVGEGTFTLSSTTLEIVNVPVTAELDDDDVLVVEWYVPDLRPTSGTLFPGANSEGETAPSYLSAFACKFLEPTSYAAIGFPEVHLVMNVHGLGSPSLVVAAPKHGAVTPGASQEITLTINASETEAGEYPFEALVATNEPDNSVLTIGVTVTVTGTTSTEETPSAPFSLSPNSPNPFAATTTIPYTLPEATHVRITVYDTVGRRVATILDEDRPVGTHEVAWDARGLASGVYVYRIEAGGFTETRQMTLVR